MQGFQSSALWILVVLTAVFFGPSKLAAEETDFSARVLAEAENTSVEFISCTEDVTPIGLIVNHEQIDFELADSTTSCQIYRATLPATTDAALMVVSREGESSIVELSFVQRSSFAVSTEVRSVIIFVGGILAAMLVRVLNVFLDPFYHTMRIYIKFRATKRFLVSVSDRFDRDVEVSNDLKKVAKGDYLTNYLLSTKLRARIQLLLTHIVAWKEGTLKPNEFRKLINEL